MGTLFQHCGSRGMNTQDSLNWCRAPRATLMKGKRGRNDPLFLIQLRWTGPKPHADWSAQGAKTQLYQHAGIHTAWGQPELLAGFPEAVGPLEGCLQPSFHWLLRRQTTTSHFWPAANYTQHHTVIENTGKNISKGRLPWTRESVWKLLMWKDATQRRCATRSKWADQKSAGWTICCAKIAIWWKANGFPPTPQIPSCCFPSSTLDMIDSSLFDGPISRASSLGRSGGLRCGSASSADACLPAIPVVGKILDSCSENSEKHKFCSFLKRNLSVCCHFAGSVTSIWSWNSILL